ATPTPSTPSLSLHDALPIFSRQYHESCRRLAVGTKLYVGSLPYSTTEQQLTELFAQHGTAQAAKVITDRYTGQSRGFGFVEMARSEEHTSELQSRGHLVCRL